MLIIIIFISEKLLTLDFWDLCV